jgi:hypothetical protein
VAKNHENRAPSPRGGSNETGLINKKMKSTAAETSGGMIYWQLISHNKEFN